MAWSPSIGVGLLNEVPLQASLREHISSATSPQYLQYCVHAKPSMLDCRRATSLLSSFSGKLCKSLAVSLVLKSAGLQSLVVKVLIRARFPHG